MSQILRFIYFVLFTTKKQLKEGFSLIFVTFPKVKDLTHYITWIKVCFQKKYQASALQRELKKA
jgi:desulfoferrodoxin (superoxide reductase-like protein)